MGNESLELVAKVIGLDPVGHVASVRSTGSDAILNVGERGKLRIDVFPSVDEVIVWVSAPAALNSISEVLTETSGSGWVGCDNNIALVSPDCRVPTVGPGVTP